MIPNDTKCDIISPNDMTLSDIKYHIFLYPMELNVKKCYMMLQNYTK